VKRSGLAVASFDCAGFFRAAARPLAPEKKREEERKEGRKKRTPKGCGVRQRSHRYITKMVCGAPNKSQNAAASRTREKRGKGGGRKRKRNCHEAIIRSSKVSPWFYLMPRGSHRKKKEGRREKEKGIREIATGHALDVPIAGTYSPSLTITIFRHTSGGRERVS